MNTLIAGCVLSAAISAAVSLFVSVYVWVSATRKREAYQREIARASEQAASEWDVHRWRESDDMIKRVIEESIAKMSPEQLRDLVEKLAIIYAEQSPAEPEAISEHWSIRAILDKQHWSAVRPIAPSPIVGEGASVIYTSCTYHAVLLW